MEGRPVDVRLPEEPEGGEWSGTQRYAVLRRIGTGGMGVVYEALDRERSLPVAVKTLLRFSPTALYRFKQEFRTLADVTHPNLVRLYELVATDSDHVFFSMELVRGVDFLSYTQRPGVVRVDAALHSPSPRRSQPISDAGGDAERTGPFGAASPETGTLAAPTTPSPADFHRLRPALAQLVAGVGALHGAGKLHRDIKPSNVLVTAEGRLVLLDFGVATDLALVLRRTNAEREVVGTARYMAPEQATEESPTTASDWYSVGAMLFEALVGRPVFEGPSRDVLLHKTLVDPPMPSDLVTGVPDDLDALCRALLTRAPGARPSGAEIARIVGERISGDHRDAGRSTRPTGSPGRARLVGRETELRALSEAFDAARAGRVVTVRVHGSAGIGKDALVQEFIDERVEMGAATALRGRAYERESMPYKALDSMIDALSRDLVRRGEGDRPMTLPRDIDALAYLFPVLRRVEQVGRAEGNAGSETLVRRRAIAALRELVAGLAAKKPLILCIRDAQWGDVDSGRLLVELVRPPFEAPVLVVLAYRDEDVDSSPFLVETRRRWPLGVDVRDVGVGPLALADAEALARTILVARDRPAREAAQAIARESGGSPLLVEELARSVSRIPLVLADPLRRATSSASGAITLESVVSARVSVLGAEERRVLELVAVCARPVPIAIIGEAAGVFATLAEVVADLQKHRFVRTGLRDGREVVEMAHDRIRETLVAGMSVAALRAHHARLARAIEPVPGADAESLAEHLYGAGDEQAGARHAERAAEQAAGKLAFDQASRLYARAIATAGDASAEGRRLRVRLAGVLERARRGVQAAEVYAAAAQHAHGFERMDLERAAAQQLLLSGHIEEGTAALDRVLLAAGVRKWPGRFGAACTFLVYRLAIAVFGSRAVVRETRDVRRVDHLRVEGLYAFVIGMGLVDVVLGICLQARHLFLALRVGDRFQLLRAAGIEALHAAGRGGPEGRREQEFGALAESLADGGADLDSRAFYEGTAAMRLFLHGRWKEVVRRVERLENMYTTSPAGWHSNAQLFYVYTLANLGRLRELRAYHSVRLAEAEERGELYTTVNLRIGHSVRVWLADDDVDAARRHVREAMAAWPQAGYSLQSYRAMVAEATIALYEGDGAAAYALVEASWPGLRRSLLFYVQYVRADAHFLRARCALASIGSLAPDDVRGRQLRLRNAAASAKKLAREGMEWTAPLAALAAAGVALAQGDRPAAIERFREAVASADAAEMLLHAAVARECLGERVAGVEGVELVREARAWMASQDIRAPDRMVATIAPLALPAMAPGAPSPVRS
jgi:eukaryotic-like serine/threonine-protein kinase